MALTLEQCEKILTKCTKSKNTVNKYTITPLGEVPMGFLGDHYKLQIIHSDKYNVENLDTFFLKTVPARNENHTNYVLELGVFQKEALLYNNLFGEFAKYHKEKIMPDSYLVDPDKFIVLEDLSAKGFYSQSGEMDLEEWKSVMETMARIHASSVIYEELNSSEGNCFKLNAKHATELKEATFVFEEGHPRKRWAENTAKSIADSMHLLEGYENFNLPQKFLKFVFEEIQMYILPSDKYRNVITHADLWKNNIMFKKTSGKCRSVFVDFQLARYAPAAFDLLTTLYVNASSDFLKHNMQNLLDLYYKTFCESLRYNNIDPANILSREDFDESIKNYTLPGLTEAALFATIIFVSDELSNDMLSDMNIFNDFTFVNRSKYVLKEIKENERFRIRYLDILKMLMDHLKSN